MEHKFYIGQEVICIDNSKTQGLELNARYIVEGLMKMKCCKQLVLSIGTPCGTPNIKCNYCGGVMPLAQGSDMYYMAKRFKPADDPDTFKEVTFTEIKEAVPALSVN